MEDATWEWHRSIFKTRGVSRGVAERRPYVRYEKGERAIGDELFATVPPSQRGATVTRRINHAGGWLMPRHRISASLPPVLPEFGPADELEPRLEPHRHTWPPRWVLHILGHARHDGENVDGVHEHPAVVCDKGHPHKALEPHRHDSVDPKVWDGHVGSKRDRTKDEHVGVGPDKVHVHDKSAKYLFAPKPWRWAPASKVDHVHGSRSIKKWHPAEAPPHGPGREVVAELGTPRAPETVFVGDHLHFRWEKAPESYARRLDVHPDTWEILEGARRVFFVIEGTLKNDAIVTASEAAFNVPSVWQWDAPELEPFARSYLGGKHVFIVPDSDWAENPEVTLAAFAARAALRRILGAPWVHVAAPTPEPAYCPLHDEPAGAKRGVDDYLADGCSLDDLEVLERETSGAMREWAGWYVEHPRAGTNERGRRSTAQVIEALAVLADDSGRAARREQAIARYLGWSGPRAYERVRRAIETAAAIDDPWHSPFDYVVADSSESALIGVNWRGQWQRAPVVVVREDLRANRPRRSNVRSKVSRT
jgi:hypothetical protein